MNTPTYLKITAKDKQEWWYHKAPTQELAHFLAQTAFKKSVLGTTEFKRAMGYLGDFHETITDRINDELRDRVLSIRNFDEKVWKKIQAKHGDTQVWGTFEPFALPFNRIDNHVIKILFEALLDKDPDTQFENTLSKHSRFHGVGRAMLSQIAYLIRKDLYFPINKKSKLKCYDKFVTDKDYKSYVVLCRAMRDILSDLNYPKKMQFQIFDFKIQQCSKKKQKEISDWLENSLMYKVTTPIIESIESNTQYSYTDNIPKSVQEGAERLTKHLQFERKRASRSYYENLMRIEHGQIPQRCDICGMNPEQSYGLSAFSLEFHHLLPISKGERKTTGKHLRMLCPNCHSAVHRWICNQQPKLKSFNDALKEYNKFKRKMHFIKQ